MNTNPASPDGGTSHANASTLAAAVAAICLDAGLSSEVVRSWEEPPFPEIADAMEAQHMARPVTRNPHGRASRAAGRPHGLHRQLPC